MYDIEVKVSLKPGMLNPEATTIQRSLALLGYCNPIIHNYTIKIIKMDLSCGCGCE